MYITKSIFVDYSWNAEKITGTELPFLVMCCRTKDASQRRENFKVILTSLKTCGKTEFSQLRFHVVCKSRHGPTDGIDCLCCLVASAGKLWFTELSKPSKQHNYLVTSEKNWNFRWNQISNFLVFLKTVLEAFCLASALAKQNDVTIIYEVITGWLYSVSAYGDYSKHHRKVLNNNIQCTTQQQRYKWQFTVTW